jgi:hypothetical protein
MTRSKEEEVGREEGMRQTHLDDPNEERVLGTVGSDMTTIVA